MSIVILVVSFLVLSTTPVHCNASSASEPLSTDCTPHCSLLFTCWLASLCSTLVLHLLTFPPETPAAQITLDIPRHARFLLQLSLLTQVITMCFVPLPSMESHFPLWRATSNQLLSWICAAFISLFTRSLHLFLGPPHGCGWGSQLNRVFLGMR